VAFIGFSFRVFGLSVGENAQGVLWCHDLIETVEPLMHGNNYGEHALELYQVRYGSHWINALFCIP